MSHPDMTALYLQQHSGSYSGPASPCYAPTPIPAFVPHDPQHYYSQMVMNTANFEHGYGPSHLAMQYASQPYANQAPYAANSSSWGQSSSTASAPASQPQSTTKRYAHNPYASSATSNSEPSSPAMSASASFASAADAAPVVPQAYYQHHGGSPVYAPTGGLDSSMGSHFGDVAPNSTQLNSSVSEQFQNLRGSICAAAMTTRGRHVLIATMRLQHAEKINAMFEEIVPNLATLMMDQNGCNVIRTLIEFLSEQQAATMVSCLTPEVVMSMATASQHTRRILQTLFERHRGQALQPLVDTIAAGAVTLSTTQQGCIALMRVLENAVEHQRLAVLHALGPHIAALTMDPYGNYVIQTVVQTFPREVSCEVLEKSFESHWVALSCNKFASNVMEKLIQAATPLTRKTILDELIYNTGNLTLLMQDGFGNFVLQAIIDTCTTGTEFRRLYERIRPQLAASPYGHKIEAKLKSKRFGPGGNRNTNAAPQQRTTSNRGPRSSEQETLPPTTQSYQRSALHAAFANNSANSSVDQIHTPPTDEDSSTA